MQNLTNMSENKKILELLKTKSSTKQEVFRVTKSVFYELSDILKKKAEILSEKMKKEDKFVEVDFNSKGDFESHFNQLVPENQSYYKHTFEGPDDMPAHIKASILGSSVTVPILNGNLVLGTWQGIYLCEHRNHGGSRNLVATIQGE